MLTAMNYLFLETSRGGVTFKFPWLWHLKETGKKKANTVEKQNSIINQYLQNMIS